MTPRSVAFLTLSLFAASARADKLDDYVRQYMVDRHIPAVAVGVFRDGKILRKSAYGLASVELNRPATTDSVFEIGSVSKQFTATVLLMLMEEGKLKLEDRIDSYLADLPETWRAVTLRHLLNHTSGIPDIEEIFGYDSYRNIYTTKQIIDVANTKPIEFPAGARWHYSNTGYFLLGLVLERVSGKSYPQILKERLFDPLGMDHTRESDPTAIIPNRACGYQFTKGELGNRDAMQPTACKGAGTLVSTLEDMAKWDSAVTHNRFLKPATQEQMWSSTTLGPGRVVTYGFGWFIDPWHGIPSVQHSGGTAGYSCLYRRFPSLGLSVMVFCNLYATGVDDIAIRAADTVHPGISYISAKAKPDPKPAVRDLFLKAMSELASDKATSDLYSPGMWKAVTSETRRVWKERMAQFKSFEFLDHNAYPARRVGTGETAVETYAYRIVAGGKVLVMLFMMTEDGKIALQTRVDN